MVATGNKGHFWGSVMGSLLLLLLATPPKVMASQVDGTASEYAKTRYPIVLVHGMFGFDTLLGVVDYWYKIPEALSRHGAQVFTVRVNALDSTYARGEELLAHVASIIALTGKAKVHLIGHSHGALTSRYVASVRPDLVATVLSVSGPNFGSRVADAAFAKAQDGSLESALAIKLVNMFANLLNKISKDQSPRQPDIMASLKALTTAEVNRFNRLHPFGLESKACQGVASLASNGVHYFSFHGNQPGTHRGDMFDLVLILADRLVFKHDESDGLVGRCSSHLGEVIGDNFAMNHLDTVNLFFGMIDASPLPIYLSTVHRYRQMGL